MRVGVGRQRRGIVAFVQTISRVKECFGRTKRGYDVSRNIAWPLGIEQAHGYARCTRLGIAHTQPQPDGIEGNVFHQRHETGPARGRLVRYLGDRNIR